MCQAVIPHMVEKGGGRAINISSIAGHNGGSATTPHYGPAKAAISDLARSLTREFAGKGVTINSVAPGVIQNQFHAVHTSPEMFEAMVKNIPIGRAGINEDVAGAVAFLASPDRRLHHRKGHPRQRGALLRAVIDAVYSARSAAAGSMLAARRAGA